MDLARTVGRGWSRIVKVYEVQYEVHPCKVSFRPLGRFSKCRICSQSYLVEFFYGPRQGIVVNSCTSQHCNNAARTWRIDDENEKRPDTTERGNQYRKTSDICLMTLSNTSPPFHPITSRTSDPQHPPSNSIVPPDRRSSFQPSLFVPARPPAPLALD